MSFKFSQKQGGFTLVEVLTVMVVLVALASITLEATSEFAFQNRYEVTKDRYEKIKAAIIGNPNVSINGQPDISGFVTDMGRLPENIRELTQVFYCKDVGSTAVLADKKPSLCVDIGEEWAWSSTPCLDPTKSDKASCEVGSTWLGQEDEELYYGWNGPYLTTTLDPDNNNSFADGWGNVNDNVNYGWNFALLPNVANADSIRLNSYGKDGATGGGGDVFDEDIPKTDNVAVVENDWKVTVDKNIVLNIASIFTGSCSVTTYQHICTYINGTWNTGTSACDVDNEFLCSTVLGNTWTAGAPGTCDITPVPEAELCARLGGVHNGTDCEMVPKNLCLGFGNSWANGNRNVKARIMFRNIDSQGKTIINSNESVSQPLPQDGESHALTFDNFMIGATATSKIPNGKVELSIIDEGSNDLYSSICISNNTTPLADCTTVGGSFSDDMCFKSDPNLCTAANNAKLIYPEKVPVKLNLSSYTTIPSINW